MGNLLDRKVAVVTGGGRGIGEAIVRTLCDEGAHPVILDKNETLGRKLADSLPNARFVHAELTDEPQIAAALNEILIFEWIDMDIDQLILFGFECI